MRTFANLISALFHPLMMVTYGVGLALSFTYLNVYPLPLRRMVFGVAFFTTSILPSMIIAVLLRTKVVSNAELTNRKERFIPYFIFILAYIACLYYLHRMRMPVWMLTGIAGACGALIMAVGINFFWKISAHCIGIGGLIGGVMGVAFVLQTNICFGFATLILIAGLVGTSRLYLGRHTPAQVYAGFALGLGCVFLTLALLRFFTE
jgi:membrane-associated phospholipid phosphatase